MFQVRSIRAHLTIGGGLLWIMVGHLLMNQTKPTLDFSCYTVDKSQVFEQKLVWWDIYFSIKEISLEEVHQLTRHDGKSTITAEIALCSFTNQNIQCLLLCFPMVFLPGTNLINVKVLYFSHNDTLKSFNDLIYQLKWRCSRVYKSYFLYFSELGFLSNLSTICNSHLLQKTQAFAENLSSPSTKCSKSLFLVEHWISM